MKARQRLRLPLRCPVMFASDEFIGEGTLVDVGVPGCAIESRITPSPGDYLRLHVLMRTRGDRLRWDWRKWSGRSRSGSVSNL